MAGQIAKQSYVFEVKKSTPYREKTMDSAKMSGLDDYVSRQIDESTILQLLQSDVKRNQALSYLNEHFHNNNSVFIFQNKAALFKGFSFALQDNNPNIRTECTKLIAKIIPQLGPDLDIYMHKVLSKIVSNIGDPAVSIQKESIQTLHMYMKHSHDVFKILHIIACDGIQHKDLKTRRQVIHSFPTLLFPEFKAEDFFDIVHSLVTNLTENNVDKELVLKTIEKVKQFIGRDMFSRYIERLPTPLQMTYTSFHNVLETKRVKKSESVDLENLESYYPRSKNSEDGSLSDRSSAFHQPRVNNPFSQTINNLNNKNEHNFLTIPFIPSQTLDLLGHSLSSVKLQACLDLKMMLNELGDVSLLRDQSNLLPLVSNLQPVIEDKDWKVSCAALQTFDKVISMAGTYLKHDRLPRIFISALAKRLGNNQNSVRSEFMKVLLHLMELVGPQVVIEMFSPKLENRQAKVREDTIHVIIASLLKFSLGSKNKDQPINIEKVCNLIAPSLMDARPNVRKATLDCFAVIAHILGPDISSLYPINNAIGQVEIQHSNATGIISAVHSRLMRKQLPRLNEKMLVEYAVYPSPIAPNMGADMQWVNAAKPKQIAMNRSFDKRRAESQQQLKSDYRYSPENSLESSTILTQPRRHLSAGKQRQFPWSDKENPENGTLPSSAPVKYQHHGKSIEKPPFRPKHTWGPESEITSPPHGLKTKFNHSFDSIPSPGPTYGEIHNRKKQQHSKPTVRSSSIAKNSNNNGYKPSFAASGNNQFSSTSNQDPTILSSSCPSSFFEKNSSPKLAQNQAMQYKPLPLASEQSPTNTARHTEPVESPIMVKPALARSATKNRDLAKMQIRSKDVLKIDDNILNIPMKLSNTSASPRFDRMIAKTSSDHTSLMRPPPPLNTKLNFSPSADFNKKFSEFQSKPTFSTQSSHNTSELDLSFPLNDTSSTSISAYSPTSKHSVHSSTSLYTNFSKPIPSNGNNNNSARHNLPKTVATRAMHSPIQSNSVIFPNNDSSNEPFAINEFQSQVSSIRRSAQNRRQRMRSQPTPPEDAVRQSPDISIPSFSSRIFDSGRSSQNSLLPESLSSTSITSSIVNKSEPPPLMYNPNTGATFHPKNVDSTLSVVGGKVGYSGGRTDSSSSTMTGSQLNSQTFKNNNFNQPDKNKSYRGSPFGAQTSSASEIISDSFNVQGVGVFSSPSSATSLEQDNSSSSPSTEDVRAIAGTETDSNLLFDGIFGRAVRNNSSDENFQKPNKSISNLSQKIDGQVSLSASLRIRQTKKKESYSNEGLHLQQQQHSNKSSDISVISNRSSHMGTSSVISPFEGKPTESITKVSSRTDKSESMNSYSRDRLAGNKSAKTGQGTGFAMVQKLPLDYPERSLSEAIVTLETADSEDWENIKKVMILLQRVATHHREVLASRYHDVIVLLSKNVHNLRSKVARTSVVTLTDIYSHVKKPLADQDLEISVQALITEFGKMNVFMRDEIDKALQSVLMASSTAKFLSALLNTGLRHKNKTIRSSTANFCSQLVDKIGPDKALGGQRDITERLLDAVSNFVCDSSPDVRQSGKTIIQTLMNHPNFEASLDRFLSAKLAQDLRDCAASIKQRGLGSGSVGSRKSSMRRSGTNSASTYKSPTSQSSSASLRRKAPGSRGNIEMDYEEVKSLCAGLSGGNLKERKDFVTTLHNKIRDNKPWVEEHILKIMDAYNNLLTTSNTKINLIGLQGLSVIIDEVGNSIRESLGVLVPALLKLSQSKQHGEIALGVVDHLISKIDHILLIPYLANVVQYGTGKSKPVAMEKLTGILRNVPSHKLQVVERQVLPILSTLLSPRGAAYTTRHEATQLTLILYKLLGQRLLDYADSHNISDRVRDILEL